MTQQSGRSILILGQNHDPHIDAVSSVLADRDYPSFFFNRHDLQCGLSVSVIDGLPKVSLTSSLHSDEIACEIGAVWWRVKPTLPSEFSGPATTAEQAFAWAEWKHFLNSLYLIVTKAEWVNPPDNQQIAGLKPHNLLAATEAGLKVPDTVFSNNADAVERILSYDNLVYKGLSGHLIHPDKFVYTTAISRVDLRENRDAIGLAPGIFQPRIDKSHEIRVTIIGDKVFVAKVDSQKSETGKVDWRIDQDEQFFSEGELSSDTLDKLSVLHADLGLVVATYDFIVTPDGAEVFLECNPAGQWLWLDQLLNLGMLDAFCDLLIEKAERRHGVAGSA